ncbi:MAG TPA: hypothetical protein VLR88_08450 [Propionibacteriaceae bacterium]|nr:hypothetical protein [Propionibacteriaceae bacterium]
MTSILFPPGLEQPLRAQPPPCLADLHLTDVIEAVGGPVDSFQRMVWHTPCTEVEVIEYRQAVVADLVQPSIRDTLDEFARGVAQERQSITGATHPAYRFAADLGRAESIARFVAVVTTTAERLAALDPPSAGLRDLTRTMIDHTTSEGFRRLSGGVTEVLAELHALEFEVGIQTKSVWVGPVSDREPWVDSIRTTFGRFHSADKPTVARPQRPQRAMVRLEADVLDLVAQLHPGPARRLRDYLATNADVLPPTLDRIAHEVRFYLDYLRALDRLAREGVDVCVPRVTPDPTDPVQVTGMVDLALALGGRATPLVANDLVMAEDERVAFITGPNQGGKTTFARAAGQVAHVASLGLPVPATAATLPLMSPVLSHFPRPDDPSHERGGLADEMVRLHDVVGTTGPSSLLILNELFSATSAEDAVGLSARILERFESLGCRVLWVTFLEDLVTSTPDALSLVGQVDPHDPTRPTFRFRAQPPTNRSHAVALAARHGLSASDLGARLSRGPGAIVGQA